MCQTGFERGTGGGSEGRLSDLETKESCTGGGSEGRLSDLETKERGTGGGSGGRLSDLETKERGTGGGSEGRPGSASTRCRASGAAWPAGVLRSGLLQLLGIRKIRKTFCWQYRTLRHGRSCSGSRITPARVRTFTRTAARVRASSCITASATPARVRAFTRRVRASTCGSRFQMALWPLLSAGQSPVLVGVVKPLLPVAGALGVVKPLLPVAGARRGGQAAAAGGRCA